MCQETLVKQQLRNRRGLNLKTDVRLRSLVQQHLQSRGRILWRQLLACTDTKKKISTSIQKERCIINCLICSTFARFRSNIFITMSISPTLQSDYSPSDESSQRKQWSCLILIASTRICLIPPLDKINWRQTEQRQEIDISHPATCLRQTVKWQEIDINPNPTPQHA